MNSSTALHLNLHGHPRAEAAGRGLNLRHGLALLALLHEQRAPLSRDAIVALLWPDAPPATARARLRRLVHEMAAALGTPAAMADGETLRLADGVTSDLAATRRAMATLDPALLGDGAAHQLLAGFTLGSEAFDDWLQAQQRAHAAAWTRAAERLAERALAGDDAALADAAAAALLRVDPCNEAGHAARLAARALQHDAAGVETAYFECAERLREELGVRPSPRLEAAYVQAVGRARAAPMALAIDFARTRDGHQVAHAAWGRDSDDAPAIVVLWGIMSNLEVALDEPRARALLDKLAERHRVVMIDRRGTGLSERVGVTPGPEAAAEDIRAVLDHLGIRRAWLFGSSVGGTLAIDFALRAPGRTAGLLLWGTSPNGAWRPDAPWALRDEAFDDWIARLTDPSRYGESLALFAPSAAHDPWVREWYARLLRNAGTRLGTAQMLRLYQAMDLRARLREVRVPTLVMQRRDDRIVPTAAARALAAGIPGARLELFEGSDHFQWLGDSAPVIEAVQRFVAEPLGASERLAA